MRLKHRWVWAALGLAALLVGGVAAYRGFVDQPGQSEYRAAAAALDRRDFQEAGRLLDESLRLRPDDLEIRLLAARTARRQEDFARAQRLLQGYASKGGSPDAAAREQQLTALQQGDLNGAEALWASCAANPRAPETALALEALVLGSMRSLGRALALNLSFLEEPAATDLARARRAADLWLHVRPGVPDQVQGLIWRARLHFFAGDSPKAVEDCHQALELAPDSLDARMNLVVAVVQKSPEEALAHLEVLRQSHPKNVSVRRLLADVHRGLGHLEEARTILDELLKADPKDVPSLLGRGQVALDSQRPEEAERWLREAQKLSPDAPEVALALSRCLRLAGRDAEARQEYERFQRLSASTRRR
jgi:tetratricopeptide (TPR) repeat protein